MTEIEKQQHKAPEKQEEIAHATSRNTLSKHSFELHKNQSSHSACKGESTSGTIELHDPFKEDDPPFIYKGGTR